MSYQEKHKTRKKVIKIGKSICPKANIDLSEYQLYIPLRNKKWTALDILTTAMKVIEQVQGLGLVEIRSLDENEQDNQFLYAGVGVEVYVEINREGVNVFLHEADGDE